MPARGARFKGVSRARCRLERSRSLRTRSGGPWSYRANVPAQHRNSMPREALRRSHRGRPIASGVLHLILRAHWGRQIARRADWRHGCQGRAG
eukprot:6556520-Alexandrium_andersonii.AAC.1